MSTDQFVLLPDQMYGNVSDHWSDEHQGDGEGEDCEDEFTSQQYLKEMERILRKIKRREARKVTFSKHLPGKKYGIYVSLPDLNISALSSSVVEIFLVH